MYTELPLIETSTPAERLAALKDAKGLLSGTPKTTTGFFAGSTEPTDAVAPDEMIRLAEYITTGHDYRDTHPEGKRRPVIKKITNVTVMAPEGFTPSQEDIEHLLGHITDGSFAQFIEDQVKNMGKSEDDSFADDDLSK